jgi:hypothetical protein
MLENLLEITKCVDFEDYGSLQLTVVKLNDEGLTLSLHLTDEYSEVHRRWEVVARSVKEHSLSLGYHDAIQCLNDHVLLWPYITPLTSTSFYGKVENPLVVVGALYKKHRELAGNWIPFHRFLNCDIDLVKLLVGGFGMLAEGPEPLILAYEELMRQHGFSTSHVDRSKHLHLSGKELLEMKASVSVLLLDDSYIIAEEFDAIAV